MWEARRVTILALNFPDIDPVAIRIFGLEIHWYALMYLLGFALAYILMRVRLKHEPFRSITKPEPYSPVFIDDVLTAVILGVLLGGRLGYTFFYKPVYYLQHPVEIIKLWDGGMSFHGGVIGVILAFAWLAWRRKRPFLQIADFVVPAAPLGLAAGRVGNFINGELWGRAAPADLPWAMIFPTGGDVPRHPSQLYQALLEGVLLFIILWLFARKPRYRGQVAAVFLVGYGIFRFIGEYFREPDAHLGYLGLGLSMGQWLSVPMIIGGIALFIWAQKKKVWDVEEPSDEDPDTEDVDDAPADADDVEDAGEDPVENPVDSEGDSGEADLSHSETTTGDTPDDKAEKAEKPDQEASGEAGTSDDK